MNPRVHARSLGLWPIPAARTVFPSRRASSITSAHCSSVAGSNTDSGVHVKLSPQFVNDRRDESARTVTGASSSYIRSVVRCATGYAVDAGGDEDMAECVCV